MQHTPKYLNGTVLGPVTLLWPHVFQPRQYKGAGEFKFDATVVFGQEIGTDLWGKLTALAAEAFTGPEAQYIGLPQFVWPMKTTETKISQPKLAELFPGQFYVASSTFADSPPSVVMPDAAVKGKYNPVPETLRSQFVYDGATCYVGIDFASYVNGEKFGLRAQLNFVMVWGDGEHVSIGAKADPNAALAGLGIDVTLNIPSVGQPQSAAPVTGIPGQQQAPVTGIPGQQQAPVTGIPGQQQAPTAGIPGQQQAPAAGGPPAMPGMPQVNFEE